MRKLILATVCVAFVGGISAASAQTTTPANQGMTKTTHPMDAQDRMMKKKKKMKKGMMKSDEGMGMKKDDGMMKDGMKKDSMKKDSMSK